MAMPDGEDSVAVHVLSPPAAVRLKPVTPPPFSASPLMPAKSPPLVRFDRRELALILNVYGRKVASGEWRDYALDFGVKKAVFAVFRRASEQPLYRIEKNPAQAQKQGAYSVVATSGLVLRRGHDLPRVLAVLEKALHLVEV